MDVPPLAAGTGAMPVDGEDGVTAGPTLVGVRWVVSVRAMLERAATGACGSPAADAASPPGIWA